MSKRPKQVALFCDAAQRTMNAIFGIDKEYKI